MMRAVVWRLALILVLPFATWQPTKAAASSGVTWHWLNPLPQGNNLQGVACTAHSTCYAVGNFGAILVTRDNGTTWTALPSGTKRALSAVACPGAASCYAVGPYGAILVTHDAGHTWTLHKERRIYLLARISCPGLQTCYVLGSDMTHQCHVPGCTTHGQDIVLLVTRNGGTSWRRINAGGVDSANDIACPGLKRCISTGYGGGTILLTTNGGRTWRRRGSLAKNVYLQAITCASDGVCHAVGISSVSNGRNTGLFLTTTDGGRTWQSSTAIPPRTGVAQYEGMACPAARVCYVTGFHGTVLFTRNGGQQWRVMRVDSLEDLGGLACAGILDCHVLGPSSAILSTTDGGRNWHDYTRGTKDELVAITCPTSTDCRALAPSGLLLVTDNGGRTWTSRPSLLHSNLGFPLPGLACPTVLICYVAGEKSTIDRTVDLGTTWQTLSNPFSRTALALAGIACPSASVCYTAGSGCLVAGCYGPDSRVVVLGTTDGGRIWHTLYDQRASDLARPADAILEAIACPTVTVCYLAGSPGLVIETKDGGRTWDDRHSPATGSNLELSGITCPAASVCDAVGTGCRGGSFGCTIGGFAGTVLTTRNGGQSWHRYESGRTVLTAGECGSAGVCLTGVNLQGIACSSMADCRTVGGDGTVLATTNGGKTWHAETTPTDNALLGIACPRPGACLAVGGGGTILGTGPAGQSASGSRRAGSSMRISERYRRECSTNRRTPVCWHRSASS